MRDTPRVGDIWRQNKAYKLESKYILIVPGTHYMRVLDLETGEVYGAVDPNVNMWPWHLWLEAE